MRRAVKTLFLSIPRRHGLIDREKWKENESALGFLHQILDFSSKKVDWLVLDIEVNPIYVALWLKQAAMEMWGRADKN